MKIILYAICILFLFSCSSYSSPASNSDEVDHSIWDKLLKKHVNSEGLVNYRGFVTEAEQFDKYLELLSASPPSEKWSREAKLSYWINAYNAFTVKLIADNYPVKGIRELGPILSIPAINTVWHKKFFKIGGMDFNLDRIEHQILRKEFNEPRIHFAIVCASISCPKLLNQAYVAERIDEQLTDQTRDFLADTSRNIISPNKVELSKIFSWFKGDFTKKTSLIQFLNKFSPLIIDPEASISYLKYNWGLNDQKAVKK